MIIWLVTIGEPVPGDGDNVRLLRTGMMAHHLADLGHEVVWWNSDFDHHKKAHRHDRSMEIRLNSRLTLRLIHGCGYTSHISLARIRDHRQVARIFSGMAELATQPDVIVAAYPTIELCAACNAFAKPRGIPVAIDVRDAWPDIFLQAAPRGFKFLASIALAPYKRFAARTLLNADAIFSLTVPFLEWALGKAGRNRNDFDAVIPMTYLTGDGQEAAGDQWPKGYLGIDPECHFVICLFCTFGRQYDISTIIEAGRLLEREGNSSVRFVLCGEGEGLSDLQSAAEGVVSVIFPGWLDKLQMRRVMRVSSMGIAPYFSDRNFIGNLPNKPIEYMSAGLPILTCMGGLLGDLILREQIGLLYSQNDPCSLAMAVSQVLGRRNELSGMSARAKAYFEENFSSASVLERYHNAIKLLLSKNTPVSTHEERRASL